MNNIEIIHEPKAPLGKTILFALPRAAASIVLTVIDFAIFFLYVEGYAKDIEIFPLYVGISTFAGKLAIAASQFFMGYLSDGIKTKRLGKRKPFILISAPILAISFSFLLLPSIFLGSNPDIMTLFLWVLIFNVLFQFFYGSLTTPYQSWMAEQFVVNQRPTVAAWQNIFNYIGTAIGVIFVYFIVPSVMADFYITRQISPTYSIFAVTYALIIVILFYITAIFLPVEKTPPIEIDLINDLKELIKDKNYIRVCMLVGISSLTWSMITGLMLGYVEKVLHLKNAIYGAGGLAIGVVCSLFIWKKIIDRVGKKKALTIIFIWAIISLPFAGIVPLFPFEDFTAPAMILVIIISASLGGWFLFPYIIYADLAENNEKTSNENELKAGLYTGFPSILLNIFQAFGYLMIGLILLLPNVPNKDYSFGYLIWAPIGSLILIVALWYLREYITLDFEWEVRER
ncbi:MAG: MFS transporter [Promethearchaeia archaeon]